MRDADAEAEPDAPFGCDAYSYPVTITDADARRHADTVARSDSFADARTSQSARDGRSPHDADTRADARARIEADDAQPRELHDARR